MSILPRMSGGATTAMHMAECWRCMLNLTIRLHPMPTGRLQKLCVTISKRNTHAPGMKPNSGRPAHALQLQEAWAAPAGHSSSERKTVPQSNKASPAEIHQTLSLLLAQLTLRPAHREHLRSPKRGLSDEQIDALGFKSTPPPFLCRSITERLIKQGCKVQGVPGFLPG